MISDTSNILGLDIGEKRTGTARVNLSVKLVEPLGIIDMAQDRKQQLETLIREHDISGVVVGLPLNMKGEETEQTRFTRSVIDELHADFPDLAFFMIDEVGTSKIADGKAAPGVSRDALAAAALLEDFVTMHERGEASNVSV